MTHSAIDRLLHRRLCHQRLTGTNFRTPADVVSWLGAVQSQDFSGAKWALSLRARGLSDADVEGAFNAGSILRTHVLRPTWHFVAPADIRWLLSLTAPRVKAMSAYYYRQHALDGRTFARSQAALERILQGGRQLTRPELSAALKRAGISAAGPRLALLVMRAELDAVICSGPRHGKQFTYALLEERVAPTGPLTHEEALEALTRRYFASHGPATLRDYVWWSGLTVREARAGLHLAREALAQENVGDDIYWSSEPAAAMPRPKRAVYLLPNYDEYLIAYKDRGPVVHRQAASWRRGEDLSNQLVIDGRLAGSWKRTPGTSSIILDVRPLRRLTSAENDGLETAAARYRRFVGMPVTLHRSPAVLTAGTSSGSPVPT